MFDYIPIDNHQISAPAYYESIEIRDDVFWNPPLSKLAASHLATMSAEEMDHNWKLNEFFGTIAVINLPQATARKEKMAKELHQIGTTSYDIFPAIDGRKQLPPKIWTKLKRQKQLGRVNSVKYDKRKIRLLYQGEAGCYMSHYKLIESVKIAFEEAMMELELAHAFDDKVAIDLAQNKACKYSRLLILEDDGGFGFVNSDNRTVTKKGAGYLLRQALQELPDDWDMLYFIVCASAPPVEYSDHLRRITRTLCTIAYGINYTMYATLVDLLKKIEDPKCKHVSPVDTEFSQIQKDHKVYAIYPSLVFHQAGQSYISTIKNDKLQQGQAGK